MRTSTLKSTLSPIKQNVKLHGTLTGRDGEVGRRVGLDAHEHTDLQEHEVAAVPAVQLDGVALVQRVVHGGQRQEAQLVAVTGCTRGSPGPACKNNNKE